MAPIMRKCPLSVNPYSPAPKGSAREARKRAAWPKNKPARQAAREVLGKYANGYFAYGRTLREAPYRVKGKYRVLYNF